MDSNKRFRGSPSKERHIELEVLIAGIAFAIMSLYILYAVFVR